ncbi:Uncharacterised protein [Fusobacterium necrophorum subsp. necrophorum]|nr:Uncharacterised protein [Fusobacterium necrophorum subsp. necrophorum]
MQEFSLIPNICMIETCRDFLEQFQVGQRMSLLQQNFYTKPISKISS